VNACFRWFLVFSIPGQEIGSGKRFRNDLFCVEWYVKPQLNQSISIVMTPPPVHLLVLQDGGWPAGTQPVPILRVTLLVFASSILAIMCKRDVIRVTGST